MEEKLHSDLVNSAKAKALLDDETLQAAFKSLEETYIERWRGSHIDDNTGREKLFLAINVIGKVRDHLGMMVANGTLAKRELDQLAQAAERKKILGIV